MGRSGQTNVRKMPPRRAGATVTNDRELRSFYVDELEHAAIGTADTPSGLIQQLIVRLEGVRNVEDEIDEADVEDLLLDNNVELCPACNWWTYSHDIILDPETEEPIGCYSCTRDPDDPDPDD